MRVTALVGVSLAEKAFQHTASDHERGSNKDTDENEIKNNPCRFFERLIESRQVTDDSCEARD